MVAGLPRELHTRIEAVLDGVRPALVADGGNVELLDVAADGTVRLELQGACATCPAQVATLRHGIEAALRRAIPGLGAVVALPGGGPGAPPAAR